MSQFYKDFLIKRPRPICSRPNYTIRNCSNFTESNWRAPQTSPGSYCHSQLSSSHFPIAHIKIQDTYPLGFSKSPPFSFPLQWRQENRTLRPRRLKNSHNQTPHNMHLHALAPRIMRRPRNNHKHPKISYSQ